MGVDEEQVPQEGGGIQIMDLEEIKRGLRAEIKKRENEYLVWLYKDCRPFKTDKLLKALTFVENNYCRKKL